MRSTILIIALIWVWNINAQDIQMLWHAEPGEVPISSLIGDASAEPNGAFMDINNDGVNEITIIRNKSNPQLFVLDGETGDKISQYPIPQLYVPLHYESIFVQVDPSTAIKEVVIGNMNNSNLIGVLEGGKVKYENGMILFSEDYVLVGTNNFEIDGKGSDLLFWNMKDQRIEIWSIQH